MIKEPESGEEAQARVYFEGCDFDYKVVLEFCVCALPVCFKFGWGVRDAEFYPCSLCLCGLHFVLFEDGNWGVDCDGCALLFDGLKLVKVG